MLIKKIMDKPVLPASILMLAVTFYYFNNNKNPDWSGVNPTSCRSAIVPLKKRAPKHWKIQCTQNKLLIEVVEIPREKESFTFKDINEKRKFIYNRMANYIVYISQNTFLESMKNVEMVTLQIRLDGLDVFSYIRGEHVSLLAGIKSQKILVRRFKEWIKTREVDNKKE